MATEERKARALARLPPRQQIMLRALKFLMAVRHVEIRRRLQPFGYDAATHDQGWRLLHACAGPGPKRAMFAELHAWWDEWAEIAGILITRRDHRRWLGLDESRRPKARTNGN
ncbi:MAG: hypothetical protein HOW73_50240 [Polyangiaceae bacterium]|nr:hypothetical protein [Polyangiaceae bacterium]